MWQPEQPPSQAVATAAVDGGRGHGGHRRRRGHASALRSIHSPSSRAREEGDELRVVAHLADRPALEGQRAGRAHQHALAAPGAGGRLAPRLSIPATSRASLPRIATSQTCAPSTSSQTRTHRVHSTQRSRSSTYFGCEASTSWRGSSARSGCGRHVVGREVLQLADPVGHADGADVVALGEQQLDDPSRCSRSSAGWSWHLDAPRSPRWRRRAVSRGRRRPRPRTAGSRRGSTAPRGGTGSGSGRRRGGRARGSSRPRAPCTSWPSMVTGTVGTAVAGAHALRRSSGRRVPTRPPAAGPSAGGTPRRQQLVLVAEVLEVEKTGFGALCRGRTGSSRAPCGTGSRGAEVALAPLPPADPVEEGVHLHRAGPARDALAAALVAAELHVEAGDLGHADGLVHDDEPARAHHRAERPQVLVVDRGVEEARPGCSRRTARRSARP
jgi:hypothetical protein